MTKIPKLVGGVSGVLRHDVGRDGLTAEHAGYLLVDRGLQSGKLATVPLDELTLARLVHEGAGILARLAGERRLAEVRQMGRAS